MHFETCGGIHQNRNVVLNEVADSERQTLFSLILASDFYVCIFRGMSIGRSRGLKEAHVKEAKGIKRRVMGGGTSDIKIEGDIGSRKTKRGWRAWRQKRGADVGVFIQIRYV